jgi:hypothetical protein
MDLVNYTIPKGQSFAEVCNLNQLALIEQTDKLPHQALYYALAVFAMLFIHFWIVPYFKSWKYYDYIDEAFSGFAFALSIILVMLMILLTVQMSPETINDIVLYGQWIFIPLIVLRLGWLLYKNYYNIKEWFKSFKEQ